jgi:anthranilate phosphoribosyltransferase
MILPLIRKLLGGAHLKPTEVNMAVRELVSEETTAVQQATFLTALAMKGEAPGEIAAFANAVKALSPGIRTRLEVMDTAGTGGDSFKTFNVSTASAIVAAAAGVRIAKHGNRAVTGKSGSADVLEAFGVKIDAGPDVVSRCIEEIGMGFLYAPAFHPLFAKVSQTRKEMGIATVFNMLGPLTNPANVAKQVVGVASEQAGEKLAHALMLLGRKKAAVVHGLEGMDEVSVCGKTRVWEVEDGRIRRWMISPSELGVVKRQPSSLMCQGVHDSARKIYSVLSGVSKEDSLETQFVAVNSGMVLFVAGKAPTLSDGFQAALDVIKTARPAKVLRMLVKCTGGSLEKLEAYERETKLS